MDASLVFQYVVIGLLVIFASYSLFKIIRKNFVSKKSGKSEFGCDNECGH